MNFYVIVSIEETADGIHQITWNKHLYILREHAFEAALKMSNSCVLMLTQTDSWNHEQIRSVQEDYE